ncbi:tyrosine-type recombinase/integrase [Brevibacillus composti]|uniref:Tyrosine-type recombinase/integrase n=1 Tax=Brevibacillus composti TaxID=2796470 RepID=A0A7T5EIG0_9BACL|nr:MULTISPECIES: tyrosine-type recombinase/integrase [Brevibacillus]MCM3592486.1 tyrosine-type recombinase/integrase [Brevibacillus borstelensis]QQE73173.1 tyrosine-type recombinase/integrase [Brevibacillus composti]QUO40252.1 tyrosine-type recombinase/integrase [Brevibacillus composti]
MALKGKRKLLRTFADTARVSYSWDELYRLYRRAKEAEGLAERTLALRDKYHRYFLEFLDLKYPGLSPQEVTADVIRGWVRYMQSERRQYEGNERIPDRMKTVGLSPGAINTYLRHHKVFFSFMVSEGYISENPFKKVRLVKEEKDTVESFTVEQIEKLLKQPDKRTYNGFRDYCAMLTFLDTGIRLVELINLRIEDVDFTNCSLYIRASNSKNNVGRTVPFSARTKKELQSLLAEVRELNAEYLFTTVYGNKLDPTRIRAAIKEYGRTGNIATVRVTPHTFRHTFAKFYILNGGDPYSLQKLLGHHDMTMVRRYVQMNDMDIRRQHDKYSPINFLR